MKLARLFGLFCVLFSAQAFAHPHVWIDSQYQLDLDQPSFHSLQARWTFDLFTSTSLILEYDVDGDGALKGQEKIAVIEVLESFDQFGYFVWLDLDGQPLKPDSISISDVGIYDQMLWAKLDIELAQDVDLRSSTLSLAFGDDSLYFAMIPVEQGLLSLSGRFAEACTPNQREAEEISIESWSQISCQL
ncbi:DUF1007 family protein [Marinomonas epiphytica]